MFAMGLSPEIKLMMMIVCSKIIWVTILTFQGHMMSSMTSSFNLPQAISH